MVTPKIRESKNIIALTSASDSKKSSFAVYCPPDEIVQKRHIKTCLGDMFSSHLIEYTSEE